MAALADDGGLVRVDAELLASATVIVPGQAEVSDEAPREAQLAVGGGDEEHAAVRC